MSGMEYNKSPISLREGKAFLDGVEIMDCIKMTIKVTPEVWTGKQLKEKTPSSRWIGATITGDMTRRRSTPWLKDKIKEYLKSGKTPELTIQGIMNDENSDYYADYGSDVITAVGCVITGDLPLITLDSDGQVLDETIAFNIKDIV